MSARSPALNAHVRPHGAHAHPHGEQDEQFAHLHEWGGIKHFVVYEELTLRVVSKTERKTLLHGVSGLLKPGEITAIMGPSGAGKSTLLNTIAGRLVPNSELDGRVAINGTTLTPSEFRRIASYVMQDDAMIGSLTVRENVMYSAHFRLPRSMGHDKKVERVKEMLRVFGLAKCADTYVGTPFLRGVSGGERRRTSIALEMVTKPSIIILDEPTSGLDSASACKVLGFLKKLATAANATIALTIHQPSSELFELIDRVHLLSSGRTFYYGRRSVLPTFFAPLGMECPPFTNPADYFLKVANTDFMDDRALAADTINKLVAHYEQSEVKQHVMEEIKEELREGKHDEFPIPPHNSKLTQIWYLTTRALLVARRDIAMYWVRVIMYIGMALLMGTVWWDVDSHQDSVQDRFSAYFFGVAFLCFMAVAGIPAFLEGRRVFMRERANGAYTAAAYVISDLIVSAPFVFIIAFAFTTVAFPMMDLRSGGDQFFKFLVYIYLALLVAENLAVAISSVLPFFIGALTITAFFNGFFMCVQGYFVRKTNIPDGWIWGHYLSYQKYSFEAMVKTGFSDFVFECNSVNGTCDCRYPSALQAQGHCQFTGEDVLKDHDYEDVDPTTWCIVLLGMIVVYRILFYLGLKRRSAVH